MVCPMQVPPGTENLPARIPAKDSTKAAVLLTFTHASMTCCQLCLAIFFVSKTTWGTKYLIAAIILHWIGADSLFQKNICHIVFYHSMREEAVVVHSVQSGVFLFFLFGSCISYSSLLWHMLLTLDPYETLILRERPPLKKRSGREERHLHEGFFIEIKHSVKKDEVCLLQNSNLSG